MDLTAELRRGFFAEVRRVHLGETLRRLLCAALRFILLSFYCRLF